MAEVMFVVKSFLVAIVLTVLMQVKVGGASLEFHVEHWITSSSVGTYLQEVATGAVKAINTTSKAATQFVSEKFGHSQTEPTATQKASRFDFEFKRSSAKAPGASATHSQNHEE